MKDILVHAAELEGPTPAMHFGVALAKAFDAALTAVYACPDPVYAAPAYQPELLAAIIENARQLVLEAMQARARFTSWMTDAGAERATWLVAQGNARDALAQAAARHDVLVLDQAAVGNPGAGLAALILEAGVPCIVVPPRGPAFEQIDRVAIAWNGSPEAMRAIHAALPLLARKQVLLLAGQERGKYRGVDWQPPFEIGTYLKRHGIDAERRVVTARDEDAGHALLDEATRFGAQLLVMGAYGRSRFSEWMLGGATRQALAQAGLPLLLHH